MRKKKIVLILLSWLLLLLAGQACVRDFEPDDYTTEDRQDQPQDGMVLIKFGLTIPNGITVATRAMGEVPVVDPQNPSNNSIQNIRIAVFGKNGYLKQYVGLDSFTPAQTNGDGTLYTCSVRLAPSNSTNLRVHVIANGPAKLPWDYEDAVMSNSCYTSEGQEGYWHRFILPNGIRVKKVYDEGTQAMVFETWEESSDYKPEDDVTAAFTRIPLLRNYAQITVQSLTDQLWIDPDDPATMAVVNVPDRGSLAVYNHYVQPSVFINDYHTMTFDQIDSLGYNGFSPNGMVLEQTDAASLTNWAKASEGVYMYERPKPIAGESPSYIIIKGTYKPLIDDGNGGKIVNPNENSWVRNCYYKIDFSDADGYYPILRNFKYRIKVTGVAKAGASTPAGASETGGSGDVSHSEETQGINEISDGYGQLYVEYLEKTLVEQTDEVAFKYKFIPDVDSPETIQNDTNHVKITVNPGGTTGNVIAGDPSFTGYQFGDASKGVVVVDSEDDPTDPGFRIARLTTTDVNENGTKKTQIIRVTGWVDEFTPIYRDITFYLLPRQEMHAWCDPVSIEDVTGSAVNLNIEIKKDLPASMFPLLFHIESDEVSVTPNRRDYPLENLPVESGRSIKDPSKQTFYFVRTLDRTEYEALVAASSDQDETVVFTSHFISNRSVSDCTFYIHEANDYFEDNHEASFTTHHIHDFRVMQFSNYGIVTENASVTFRFRLGSTDTQDYYGRVITVELDGLVPASGETSLTPTNVDDVYTFTAQGTSVDTEFTIHLKTESGENWKGTYSVKLSNVSYHDRTRSSTEGVWVTSQAFAVNNSNASFGNNNITSKTYTTTDGSATVTIAFSSVYTRNNSYIQMDRGSTVTVSCSTIMNRIVLTASGNNYNRITSSTPTGATSSGSTCTWTGDAVSSVRFTSYNSNNRERLSSVTVTYMGPPDDY